jgi:hypothetical protein
MKQFLLLTATIFVAFQSTSIFAQHKPSFGIQAGAAFAKATSKYGDIKMTMDMKAGMTFGMLLHNDISDYFAIQPALNFIQKGGVNEESGDKTTITMNYLELPVNFLYQSKNNGKGRFFAGGGPSFGYAMGGKGKYEYNGETEEEDIKIGSGDDDDMKPFEFGVNFLAGYQLAGGLFFSAGYNVGLNNIMAGATDDASLKNQYFNLRIGYLFKRNKSAK